MTKRRIVIPSLAALVPCIMEPLIIEAILKANSFVFTSPPGQCPFILAEPKMVSTTTFGILFEQDDPVSEDDVVAGILEVAMSGLDDD